MSKENWDELLGEAAENQEVVKAAKDMQSHVPDCARKINQHMAAYEVQFDKLVTLMEDYWTPPSQYEPQPVQTGTDKFGPIYDTSKAYVYSEGAKGGYLWQSITADTNRFSPLTTMWTLAPIQNLSAGPGGPTYEGTKLAIKMKPLYAYNKAPYSNESHFMDRAYSKQHQTVVASYRVGGAGRYGRTFYNYDGDRTLGGQQEPYAMTKDPPVYSFRAHSFGGHSPWTKTSAEKAGLDPDNDAGDYESWSKTPFLEEPFIKALEDGGASVEFLQLSYELLVKRNHGGWGAMGAGMAQDTLYSLLLPTYNWNSEGAELFGAGGTTIATATKGGTPVVATPMAGPAFEDLLLAGNEIERWKGDRSHVQAGARIAPSEIDAVQAYQQQAMKTYTEAKEKCAKCTANPKAHGCLEDVMGAMNRYPPTWGKSTESLLSCGIEKELYKQASQGLFGFTHVTTTTYKVGDVTVKDPTTKGSGDPRTTPLFNEPGGFSGAMPDATQMGGKFYWWNRCWQFGKHGGDRTVGETVFHSGQHFSRDERLTAQEERMEELITEGLKSGKTLEQYGYTSGAEEDILAFSGGAAEILAKLDKHLYEMIKCVKEIQKYTDAYEEALYNYLREAQEVDGLADYLEFAMNYWCKFFTGEGCTDQAKEKQEEFNKRSQEKLAEHLGIEYGRRILYKEQCFLLSFINEFIDYKKNTWENPVAAAKRDKGDPSPPQAKRLPYYSRFYGTDDKTIANACIQVEGDPYGFMNRLTQSPTQAELFKIEPHKLGHLQPMIRLFKINYDIDGNARREMQQEIPFEQSSKDIASALSDKNKRGAGVGIKKFMFVYDGSNPFAAKKSIKGKLVIFANSFDDLLKDRGGWRYVDLALKTAGGKLSIAQSQLKAEDKICNRKSLYEENENLSKLNFRLKAVVGYARPSNDTFLTSQQKDAIYNSYVTLNLTPTVHDFAFDDMGRVTFTINYLAYVEDFFDQSLFNIFSEIETTKQRVDRNLRIKKWKSECDADQINKIKQSFADEILEEKRTSVQSVVSRLLKNNSVRYLNIPYAKITNFTKSGPFGKMSDYDVSAKIEDGVSNTEAWEKLVKKAVSTYGAGGDKDVYAALTVTNPNNESLPFFYVSDLVDVVLEQIGEVLKDMPGYIDDMTKDVLECDREVEKDRYIKFEQQFKRFRCLLGPLEVVDPADAKNSSFGCLGDIPISLKYFVGWLTNQLSKKDESVYPLAKFLNDLFNNLVKNFMNSDDCYGVSVKQKVRMQQAAITAYPWGYEKKRDTFTDMILANWNYSGRAESRVNTGDTWRQPILHVMGPENSPITDRQTEQEFNYLTFFIGRTQPIEKMKGIRSLDEKVGIFHYMIGQPNGIVKKINLTKTDSKGLAEVRFEQDGYDGLKQLRVVYDVNVKTFANVQVFPGTYIFVEPLGFAPNMASYGDGVFDLSEYGIGGYCMVYRSTHVFGPGLAETQIEAKWVNAIDKEAEEEERSGKNADRQAGDNADGYDKCSAEWRSAANPVGQYSAMDLGGEADSSFGEGLIRDTIALFTGDD